ncbi:MAG: UDP-N-acetylmuramoyl-L-alanyl-D-glutamate--2,6-diaminopimelate ligase [Clostridia bacterium]|nr:UDP-N-acetylmuramoyl-L-alanyl-D-glutamate--2,6-diaminopimelate ligase [Clostridia bacterium]
MKLSEILKDVEILEKQGDLELEITNLGSDSRKLSYGALFFAIKGFTLDGTKYIDSSINNGAVAVVVENDFNMENCKDGITYIKVQDIRYCLAICASEFYGNPSKKLKVIGVTGTKGKTTSTFMIKSILEKHGYKVGLIGSIAVYIGNEELEITDRTTPESFVIQKYLAKMVEENVDIAILEVSSQAMVLNRVTGIEFDATLFTNLTEDHISPKEHKDMEDYFNAKLSLMKISPYIVTTADNSYTARIPKLITNSKICIFGIDNKSEIMAKNLRPTNSNTTFTLLKNEKEDDITVSIPGEYMVMNALGAISISSYFGATVEDFKKGLSDVKVFGRSEMVPNKLGLTIMIDYAHTPSSLESILKTVKPYTKGRVICTWGVGGDRDAKKRPIMGEISGRLADYTVLTSDQVRTEEPIKILREIETGLKEETNQYSIILNRTEAIRFAIKMANPDDIIVIPGLGNDLYIEYNNVKYPYDERVVIHDIIEEILENKNKIF